MSYNPENEIFSFDFVPDPRSGQPRLTCDRDDVGKRDLDLLSSELRENYEVLCAGSGSKTFEFKSRLLTLPQRYLVTMQRTDYTGMPGLHLTSLPGGNRDSSVGKNSLEVSCESCRICATCRRSDRWTFCWYWSRGTCRLRDSSVPMINATWRTWPPRT